MIMRPGKINKIHACRLIMMSITVLLQARRMLTEVTLTSAGNISNRHVHGVQMAYSQEREREEDNCSRGEPPPEG